MAKLQRRYSQDNFDAQLIFPDNSEVDFKILRASETRGTDAIVVKAEVLTGENKGKCHSFYMSYEFKNGNENFNTTNFLKLFYSFDQLSNGEADLDDLAGRLFSATTQNSKCGKYLNWINFIDLGEDSWKSPISSESTSEQNLDYTPF